MTNFKKKKKVSCLFIASGQITITKIILENRIEVNFETVLIVKDSITNGTVLCPVLADLGAFFLIGNE